MANCNHLSSRRAGGFTLLEVLASLLLLGTFTLVATRLFVMAHGTTQLAWRTQSGIERLDNALRQLRNDVWDAVTLQSSSETQLRVTQNPDKTILWNIQSDGALTRSEQPPAVPDRSWHDLPPMKLSVHNRMAVLAITENNQSQDMTFTSQITPEGAHE